MKKQMRLLITGTPCVGKTTLAAELSRQLDCPLVSANDLAAQLGCCKLDKKDGVREVDLKVLQKHLKKLLEEVSKRKESVVVEGHLLCEMKLPCEKLLVLRCNPLVLEKRFKNRKYASRKVSDNLLSEILDYCLLKSEANYPAAKIVQLDASKPPSASNALKKLDSGKSGKVDWSGLLVSKEFSGRYVF